MSYVLKVMNFGMSGIGDFLPVERFREGRRAAARAIKLSQQYAGDVFSVTNNHWAANQETVYYQNGEVFKDSDDLNMPELGEYHVKVEVIAPHMGREYPRWDVYTYCTRAAAAMEVRRFGRKRELVVVADALDMYYLAGKEATAAEIDTYLAGVAARQAAYMQRLGTKMPNFSRKLLPRNVLDHTDLSGVTKYLQELSDEFYDLAYEIRNISVEYSDTCDAVAKLIALAAQRSEGKHE